MAIKVDRSQFTRSFANRNKLVPLLDRAIAEGDFDWTYNYTRKKGDDAFHPSGDCLPSVFELYNGIVNPSDQAFSGSLYKTFQVGHFWHNYLQELCLRNDLVEECNIERKGKIVWGENKGTPLPYHWACGAGDLAPVTIPGHGDYLVDIKTQNARDYAKNGLPDWCADKYEAQINIYMEFFNLERAIILCVCKDSPHEMKEIEYRRNQPLIDNIFLKWRMVSECLASDVQPPKDEHIELSFEGSVLA